MPSKDDKAGRKEEAILLLQKAANWLLGGGIIACSKRCQTQGVSQNGQEWQSHVSESEEARGKTPEGVTFKKSKTRAPLVVQWLRVLLLVQGTLEDPMCRRATKPVLRNSRACAALECSGVLWSCSWSCSYQAQVLQSACSTTREATATRNPHTATKQ